MGQQWVELDLEEGSLRDEVAGPPLAAPCGDTVAMDAMTPGAEGAAREQAGAAKGSLVATLGVFCIWGSLGGLPFAILGGLSSVLAAIVACFRLPELKGLGGEVGASNYDRLREHVVPELTYPYLGQSLLDVARREGGLDGKGTPSEALGTRVKRRLNLRDTLKVVVLDVAGMQSMAWGVVEVVVPFFLQQRCELGTIEVGVAIGINNFVYAFNFGCFFRRDPALVCRWGCLLSSRHCLSFASYVSRATSPCNCRLRSSSASGSQCWRHPCSRR